MQLRRLVQWYLEPWRQYARFEGRSPRIEFWTFTIVNMVIFWGMDGLIRLAEAQGADYFQSLNQNGVDWVLAGIAFYLVFLAATAIPGVAVTVRRLHDIGRSGWYWCLTLIPVIGTLILWVMAALKGNPEANQYGLNPMGNT
mgnify:CR=1 FL=1